MQTTSPGGVSGWFDSKVEDFNEQRDKVGSEIDEAKDAIGDKVDEISEKVEDVKDAVDEKVEELSEKVEDVKKAIDEKVEDVKELAADINEEYNLTTRAMGIATAAGGVGEVAVGLAGVVTPEPITTLAGGAVVAHGVDTFVSGVRTGWTGESHATFTEKGATAVAEMSGMERADAEKVGAAVDFAVGSINPTGAGRKVAQSAITEGAENASKGATKVIDGARDAGADIPTVDYKKSEMPASLITSSRL